MWTKFYVKPWKGTKTLHKNKFNLVLAMNARFSQPLWHLVDAKDKVAGRLATQIVTLIRGKHKPNYTPWYDCGDYVVVINAKDVKFTGDKVKQKNYVWHTGYPGGIKQRSVRDQLKIKPEEVLFRVSLS